MPALMRFTDWITRFTNEEYSLLRHRMRAVQFAGPNVMRRWDVGTATNEIDLDEQMIQPFKELLIKDSIISAERAEEIFSLDGTVPDMPDPGAGPIGPQGPQGEAGEVGPPGPAGPAGEKGDPGDPGAPGEIGPQGIPGTPGAPGPAGEVGPDGAVGAQGSPGEAGPAGPPGPAGEPGPQGEVGQSGTPGVPGPVGPGGPEGAEGPQGIPGNPGAQGQQGVVGPQGDAGPPGPAGPAGPVGADSTVPGPMGPQGFAGPPGEKGEAGLEGPPGPVGADGVQGPAGAGGVQGEPGQVGPQGIAGPEGPQGVMGPVGPVGSTGGQGEVGPQGAPGPSSDTWSFIYNDNPTEPPTQSQIRFDNAAPHQASKIWIGHVSDGVDIANYLALIAVDDELYTQDKNDSTSYDVFTVTAPPVNKGSYTEIAINFNRGSPTTLVAGQAAIITLMRKGSVGAQGPQGTQGLQGMPGPQGPQGIQGPQGLKGDTGTTGSPGIQGSPGTQGIQGAQGPAGPNAVSANAGNNATLGSDNLVLVRNDAPIKGRADGSDAAAGMVGQYISASNTAGSALVTATPLNVATLALPAGDWDVWGQTIFAEGANTIPTILASGTSPNSALLPTPAQLAQGLGAMTQVAGTFTKGLNQIMQTGPDRYSLAAPANVYLVAQATFTGGTLTVTGFISARRQ